MVLLKVNSMSCEYFLEQFLFFINKREDKKEKKNKIKLLNWLSSLLFGQTIVKIKSQLF